MRKSANAAQLAAEAAKEQADSTERSLASTSAAYCQPVPMANASVKGLIGMSFSVKCSPNKVDATLLDGSFEVSLKDLSTGAKIGDSQKFSLTHQLLKPGIGYSPIDFSVPANFSEAEYFAFRQSIFVEGVIDYDDGFHRTIPNQFCYQSVPSAREPSGHYSGYGFHELSRCCHGPAFRAA